MLKAIFPVVLFLAPHFSMSQPGANIQTIRFIGEYVIGSGTAFQHTTVGGLSGIDYDAENHRFYLISDDKGEFGPARFYTADIIIDGKGIHNVRITGMNRLLAAGGDPYPGKKEIYQVPDPEAMRLDAVSRTLTWSTEGERITNATKVLEDPAITIASLEGRQLGVYPLPPNLKMQAGDMGPRRNGTLEGLTFAANYGQLLACMEEPMYEDGPRATITDNKAYVRIFKFETASKKNTGQYGYKLEKVAHAPFPAGSFHVNGVSDILSLGDNKLLTVERSFSTGRISCTVRLFITDLARATDITKLSSLASSTGYKTADKTLLLDMDELSIHIDNIEGVCFGPLLPNGHKTLVFVADNNFNPLQKTQLLLFEVIE